MLLIMKPCSTCNLVLLYLAWYMRGTDPFCGRVFMCVFVFVV